jgi:hypothetical protein
MKSGKITHEEAIAALEAQHAATVAGQAPTVLTDPAQARGAARENPRSLGVNAPPVDRAAGADTSDDPADPNHGRQFPFSRQAQWASEQQAKRAGVVGPISGRNAPGTVTGGEKFSVTDPNLHSGTTWRTSGVAGGYYGKDEKGNEMTGTPSITYDPKDNPGEANLIEQKYGTRNPNSPNSGGFVAPGSVTGNTITDAKGNALNRQTGVVTPFKAPNLATVAISNAVANGEVTGPDAARGAIPGGKADAPATPVTGRHPWSKPSFKPLTGGGMPPGMKVTTPNQSYLSYLKDQLFSNQDPPSARQQEHEWAATRPENMPKPVNDKEEQLKKKALTVNR